MEDSVAYSCLTTLTNDTPSEDLSDSILDYRKTHKILITILPENVLVRFGYAVLRFLGFFPQFWQNFSTVGGIYVEERLTLCLVALQNITAVYP